MPGTLKKRAETHEPTPIVTFYSYKGGVGRSMAVLNVASLIASRGFRVLIIDFDLEAPGLSHLIGKEAIPAKGKSARNSPSKQILKPGVVELLSDAVLRGPESDLLSKPFSQIAEKYTFSYNPPEGLKQHSGAKLSIMPAGRLDEEYSARLDQLDLPGLYKEPENSGKRLILRFREILIHSGHYDYILVDSRTGHSDEAGICTRDLADHRMIVSGLNTQNITGTAAFLRNLRSALRHEGKDLITPDIILSPVPNGEDDLVSVREEKARQEFQAAWQDKKLKINLLIPYHPRLALTEEAYVPAITASPLRNAYLEIEGRVLRSLGHVDWKLEQEFRKCVKSGDGPTALHIICRLVRLQRTPQFPGQIPVRTGFRWSLRYEEDFLKQIIQLDEALDILKLYAENHFDRFETTGVGKKLHELQSEIAACYDQFVLKMDRLHPDELGSYANFLADNREKPHAVEAFYKRAIEADPKHANSLGDYANFLKVILKDNDAAETFYKRAIDADPKNATILGNYAIFLSDIRKNNATAEAYYKRAIDAEPNNVNNLGNYAIFLTDIREKYSDAEIFYKRAIAANPKHLRHLTNYAHFLRDVKKDLQGARQLFDKAVSADPKNVNRLGDYGQLLIGIGQLADGIDRLRAGWANDKQDSLGNTAEMAFSLWLGTLLINSEESVWERTFKHLIEKRFRRHQWNFDAMLSQARKKLKPTYYNYAKALAAAFLDESQVPALEKYSRWRKLQPLDPALVNLDGTIREPKKF